MREWPMALFGSRPMLPITSKILLKFYTDTKKTQTPVREENLLKRKFFKNLSKKKNEFKKKKKKCGKIAGCNAIEKPHTRKIAN